MGARVTRKAVRVIGTEKYVNANTGELEEMSVISVEERDFNFHKLWLHNILNTIDLIGNQKIKFAFWIIEHLNSENQLNYTVRQLETETGFSKATISRTMKALMECDFLRKKHSGCYVVNPDILYKGRHQGRMNVLIKYRDTKIKTKTENVEIVASEKLLEIQATMK